MKWKSSLIVIVMLLVLCVPVHAANHDFAKAIPWENRTAVLYDSPGGAAIGSIVGHAFKVSLLTYDGGDGYRYCYYEGRLGVGYLRISLTPETGAVKYTM